jgi:hypothetical protein
MSGRVRCPIIGGRKDFAMRNQRSFSVEFNRQVIQEWSEPLKLGTMD